jgi:nitroimidazol reductase NimA-like FMN-containing flavoprotein (pyridoxamine 5'-phosphate oxidase superfamily)
MKNRDEPVFDEDDIRDSPGATADPAVRERIRHLADQQPYAVLCVQGEGQPYGALVAFAFSEDLRHAVFVTPVATRKYRLLSECDHVALVIDNRPNKADKLMEIEAVTVTGRSQLIERGGEFDRWAELLINRHPYLKSFVKAATCALFRVDVVRFLHVARFQEVSQWIPGTHS